MSQFIQSLAPMKWVDGWPVIGVDGRVPEELNLAPGKGLIPGIVASDEFDRHAGDRALPLVWQWNHNPDHKPWSLTAPPGHLRLTTWRPVTDFLSARNTRTQRMISPECSGTTAVDVCHLNDGDVAGELGDCLPRPCATGGRQVLRSLRRRPCAGFAASHGDVAYARRATDRHSDAPHTIHVMTLLIPKLQTCAALVTATLLAAATHAAAAGSSATLKDAFKDDFMVGVALNQRQFSGQDTNGAALALRHYNSISPENVMKWENIHPRPGPNGYDFAAADRFVEFGEQHGMFIVGHTLVWHSQTPRWVFQGEGTNQITREILLGRMREHIHTVVARYKGRIHAWDVVNEALNEDGSLRRSPWYRIIGEDYIARAFEYAHAADPSAELRYNDYSIENVPKRKGTIALVKQLQAQNVPISGLGSQTHANLTWPGTRLLDATLTDFAALGLPISITELDVNASAEGQGSQSADVAENAAAGGLMADAGQKLAAQYASLFRVFRKHRQNIKLVTFWGVTDRDSWRSFGTPLLFDRRGQPKPAFDAVIQTASEKPQDTQK